MDNVHSGTPRTKGSPICQQLDIGASTSEYVALFSAVVGSAEIKGSYHRTNQIQIQIKFKSNQIQIQIKFKFKFKLG